MQAAVFEGPGRLEVRDVAYPQCSRDGLIIRVEACAICGTDVRILLHGQANVKLPQVLGHEIAGIVAEVGPEVSAFRVGDRVAIRPGVPCGRCRECQGGMQNLCTGRNENRIGFGYSVPGGFAEYMHVPGQAIRVGSVMRVPDGVELDEVAIFEPLGCVINGQEMVAPTVGESVVIIGAGPIGCMHLLLAKMRGAAKTIVIDVLSTRLELARRFGPTELINASNDDPVASVLSRTGGADVVIVACSSPRAQEQALEMARAGGRISYFAGLPHEQRFISFDSNLLHYKQLALFGVRGANFRQHQVAFDLLVSKQIDGATLVTHRFPLADINEAFRLVQAGEGLKVVIKPHI